LAVVDDALRAAQACLDDFDVEGCLTLLQGPGRAASRLDAGRRVRLLLLQAQASHQLHRWHEALRACDSAHELATRSGLHELMGDALRVQSQMARRGGDPVEALLLAEQAWEHIQHVQDPTARGRTRQSLGSALYAVGRLDEAQTWWQAAEIDLRRAGLAHRADRLLLDIAVCMAERAESAHDRGDPLLAQRLAREGLDALEGWRRVTRQPTREPDRQRGGWADAHARLHEAALLILTGRLVPAREELDRVERALKAEAPAALRLGLLRRRARWAEHTEGPDGALSLITPVFLDTVQVPGTHEELEGLHHLAVRLHEARGDHASALHHHREADELRTRRQTLQEHRRQAWRSARWRSPAFRPAPRTSASWLQHGHWAASGPGDLDALSDDGQRPRTGPRDNFADTRPNL
jgi:tetratricopeptide (TPR) repeat protein